MEKSIEKTSRNMSILFAETQISDPITKEKIKFRYLWEKNEKPFILILWMRRFGCPLCRMVAIDVSTAFSNAPEEIKKKIKLCAMGISTIDLDDFTKGDYFKNNPIYIDEEKETYKTLDFGVKGIFSLYGALNLSTYTKIYQANKRGIRGSFKGDGFQLGGTFLIRKDGEVLFTHVQKNYADQPDFNEIIKIVKQS